MNAKGTSATVATSGHFLQRRNRSILIGRLAAMAAAGCLTMSMASATLITFDDLPTNSIDPDCGCSLPTRVDNQYASLGVIFSHGGGLQSGSPGVVSEPNVLTDFWGPQLGIRFTGDLPTSVSMYVSASFLQDTIHIEAYGPAGFLGTVLTDGWRGSEEESTPYRDKQLVTFTTSEISHLFLSSFHGRRGDIEIDDLSFSLAAAEISEPAALGLVVVGLALLLGITITSRSA